MSSFISPGIVSSGNIAFPSFMVTGIVVPLGNVTMTVVSSRLLPSSSFKVIDTDISPGVSSSCTAVIVVAILSTLNVVLFDVALYLSPPAYDTETLFNPEVVVG